MDRHQQSQASLPLRVADALKHWHAIDATDGMFDDLLLFRQASRQDGTPRHANNVLLRQALAALRRHYPASADLLELRYLDGWAVDRVAIALNFGESTIYRRQHQAIVQLAATLAELEAKAWQGRAERIEQRLDSTTHTHLVGIERQLEQLAAMVVEARPPWILSIEGIGGIGKTALADALVRRLGQRLAFDDVAWASAQPAILDAHGAIRAKERPALSAASLVQTLLQQLAPADAPGVLGRPEAALAMLHTRLKDAPHLVVVDNLETLADLEALLPTLRKLANPSKFLLTSRKRLIGEHDIYLYPVPELVEADALALVRLAAAHHNVAGLSAVGDDALHPLYAAVGGNPLALLLLVGQLHMHDLESILHDLTAARGAPIENLYTFIYRRAWDNLDPLARRVLLTMSLVKVGGDYLVNPAGDVQRRRYTIHSLTRSFLHEQVARWK